MPFEMRDETAGINILYVNNLGQMGLGSLPNSGQQLTVQGTNVISTAGNFACGAMPPGVQRAIEGSVSVPAGGSVAVAVSTAQPATVSAALRTAVVNNSEIVFVNDSPNAVVNSYSIW
jgi:hypothetical protein